MTYLRRAGTVLATVLLTVGLVGAGPADAKRDTNRDTASWSDSSARDTSWGR